MISMTWPQYMRQQATVAGVRTHFSPNQAKFLLLLLLRRGQIVTKEEVAEFVWEDADGGPLDVRNNAVVMVCRLNAKGCGIITHHSRGYELPK